MKKLFFLAALFTALIATTSASAQGGPGSDPQQFRQRMMERMKPMLIEKTHLSDVEAEKVLDIYATTMPQRREIRMDGTMSDDDKKKKIDGLNEEMSKKYKAIPLTDEQVKSVDEFFKNMPNRRNGQGGNNGNNGQ